MKTALKNTKPGYTNKHKNILNYLMRSVRTSKVVHVLWVKEFPSHFRPMRAIENSGLLARTENKFLCSVVQRIEGRSWFERRGGWNLCIRCWSWDRCLVELAWQWAWNSVVQTFLEEEKIAVGLCSPFRVVQSQWVQILLYVMRVWWLYILSWTLLPRPKSGRKSRIISSFLFNLAFNPELVVGDRPLGPPWTLFCSL